MGLAHKIYGNMVVLAAAWQRRGMAHRDRQERDRLRDKRVRQLVRFAARTVPHYTDWFRENRLDVREIRTADDLAMLPVLEKAEVRSDPERFRSTARRGSTAIRFTTSGSTGTPLVFYHDRRSILANIARSERSVKTELIGRDHGYRRLGIVRSGSTIGKVREFTLANTFIPMRPQRRGLDVADPLDEVVRAIRELKPDLLSGYGSYLEMLFRYLHEREIDIPLPRLVTYAADGMTLPGRQLISDVFGIPVVGSYSAIESFKIAFQCGQGSWYHLYEDLCHVRIAGPDGETLPKGEAGNIVITNLVNRGSVLLNYRLGDVGSLSSRQCECGRTLRLLENLEGRAEDMLVLANGEFLHPRAIWAVLRQAEGLLRYQLIQLAPDRFELKLVTTAADVYERIVARSLPELRSLLGGAVRIDTARLDELPPNSAGKFRPVISNVRWGAAQ